MAEQLPYTYDTNKTYRNLLNTLGVASRQKALVRALEIGLRRRSMHRSHQPPTLQICGTLHQLTGPSVRESGRPDGCDLLTPRPEPALPTRPWPERIKQTAMTAAQRSLTKLVDLTLRPLRAAATALRSRRSSQPSGPGEIPAASAQGVHPDHALEGSTHVVFLPRDPQWGYCFWAIHPTDQERARALGATLLCLRLEDVTGLDSNRAHPHALMELVVDQKAHEWYLPVPVADRDYRIELGYRLASGGWFTLAVSSTARVPGHGPSEVVADAFVPFSLTAAPSVATAEPLPASGGVTHELMYQQATRSLRWMGRGSELWQEGTASSTDAGSLNDSGIGLWASGRHDSGAGGVLRQRSFWLVADAELIVYGATDPAASLTIGDQPVPLGEDGTFRLHVPFHDGEQVYPITAIAADGEQKRSIRLNFSRSTPEANVNNKEQAVQTWF